ncbi:hypothetical protein M0805_003625 [Coniferiporia weirii]|nr:hypothetical protein M0805_003625 [Coniferiporia weirii]
MVSSRSKAAAEAAANKRTTRSASGAAGGLKALDTPERENKSTKKVAVKKSAPKPASKSASSTTTSTKSGAQKKGGTYCICGGEDDGTPMIKCEGGCKNWYHFQCMDLSEDVAGEIERYYCPDCEASTGLKTIMDFEGPDALLEVSTEPPPGEKSISPVPKRTPVEVAEVESAGESEDNGSEDDYIAEPAGKSTKAGKRVTRRLSFSSDKSASNSDGDSDGGVRKRPSKGGGRIKRIKKTSPSPAQGSSFAQKRRGSSAQQPAAKRSKTVESAQDDALRRYCLSKLEEIIRPMFEEYPAEQEETKGKEKGEATAETKDSSTTELDDEEKNVVDQKIKSFAAELEQCMMETYAEPDKSGKLSAAGKYKERFRMLQFNLPKPDRVVLRKGIATGRISPAQLNVMSSTDLADEQTKHDIEVAEKESLKHSILQRVTAPRAKITHKGFEAIEDVSGQRTADVAKEEEEQRMEMEKREREKLARLRLPAPSNQEGPSSAPVEPSPLSANLPTSPTTANTLHSDQTWGAPPPLPIHLSHSPSDSVSGGSVLANRPPVRPLFIPSASDYSSAEQGLSLADLINIDDDLPKQENVQSNPQQRMSAQLNADPRSSLSPVITTPSGPSPFAPSKPAESPRRTSFDLNSLWTGGDRRDSSEDTNPTQGDQDQHFIEVAENASTEKGTEEVRDDEMEIESVNDYDDQVFDAILEKSDHENVGSPPQAQPIDINTLPQVWEGQLFMPLDPINALASDVTGRQIGGRGLEPLSGFWQTLFPSPQARIDGRVPVNTSAQYLVTTRLKPMKELIAVCFTPRTETAAVKYNELIDYLVRKDRNALVFPWGNTPQPQAPGRELYIIPLLKDSPIPEYIELLDELLLPAERPTNLLLGLFVLNKGKLVASTPPPLPEASTSVAQLLASMPAAPLQNILSNLPVFPPPIPAQPMPAPSAPPVKIDQAALAAEVASLTPEQISLMLRHLSQSAPLAATVGVPVPQTMPPPPGPSSAYSMPPAMSVIPSMPPFPPQFQPPYPQHIQPPSHSPLQHHSPQHMQSPPQPFSPSHPPGPGYGDYDYDDRNYQGQPYGRDERGRRGGRGRGNERARRGGRGRGKSYNGDRDSRQRESDHRSADQGWGGRGRGGGPSGNSSHDRRSRFSAD